MSVTLTLRTATLRDLAAVDRLLSRSYPRLLRPHYPPSVMVLALPIISRARPELLLSGRYILAFSETGALVGAGGWSVAASASSDRPRTGHVRHVATDPDAVRQGVGRAVMDRILAAATEAGIRRMECLSTRAAVPFYRSLGFQDRGPVEVPLRPGIGFPAVAMVRTA